MASIPGSFNGGIPPNVVWDENNPPIKHSCSDNPLVHIPDCKGDCEDGDAMGEHEVELLNEHLEWSRIGMNPQLIGTVLTPFDMDLRISVLSTFLADQGIIDLDELNVVLTRSRVERMKKLREDNQEAVRRMRLGMPPKPPLLGPTGEPL